VKNVAVLKPSHRLSRLLQLLIILAALLVANAVVRLDTVGAAPQVQKPAVADGTSADDLQRSLRLDTYRSVAESGAARGEEIYFYKCWMCHNQYTKSAPLLKGLFERANLASGDPVSDDNVTAKIRAGSVGMPAFRTSLSDADITDLRAYFSFGKMLR
jgi:mono/diheme cytochrome c family protein